MNKHNNEGYPDPTAYEALTAVAKDEKKSAYRPLVFICSPFAGDIIGNVERARRYSRFAVERGAIPIAPHLLYPQFMDDGDAAERALGLFFGTVLLGKCDQLWAFGDTVSAGMKLELAKARSRGIPVKLFTEDCEVKT